MTFWELVFAFGCALFLDRATAFLFRRLGTFVANRAWDRATRPRAELPPVVCFLCGEPVDCGDESCMRNPEFSHSHNECMDDYEQEPGPGVHSVPRRANA